MSKKNVAKELADAKAKVAALEKAAAQEREQNEKALREKIGGLHKEFGFGTPAEFHTAYGRLAGIYANRGGKGGGKIMTEEKTKEMVDVLKKDELTIQEVADQFGVSSATVSIVKRTHGLTKTRNGTAATAA